MAMKTRTQLKPKGSVRVKPQQMVYELKHRVVVALNKLADRDTHKIGVEELGKIVESLTPEGIVPFLSCILDSDSEQKSAVRKECVRMMGVLADTQEDIICSHLGKMVASIVKRLKDPDSIVKDACVETMRIFALKFGNNHSSSTFDAFVTLVKPCFEALGEQNKHIQSGAALCLAKVIDSINDPPVSILQKMLFRSNKLLKNPHFMAKPAVIELNKSIILAGGASSRSSLSSAICSIQEVLKCSDWTTRKAASLALGEIATNGGFSFAPFKASCIHSLESCRFDKIKPVRDSVLQALYCWKRLPGSDGPEFSETGSTKENSFGGDFNSDLTSASSSLWKDVSQRELTGESTKQRAAASFRKPTRTLSGKSCQSKSSDWHIEIAVPNGSKSVPPYEEACSSTSKTQGTICADVFDVAQRRENYGFPDDNKQELSSASNNVSDNYSNKFMTISHSHVGKGDGINPTHLNTRCVSENDFSGPKSFISKMQDRQSIDSTVTEEDSHVVAHVCCNQSKSEIVSIRQQLEDIEKRQASLMEMMQVFTNNTTECLYMIQSKILTLEHGISDIANGFAQPEYTTAGEYVKKSRNDSPRLSICTPRSSSVGKSSVTHEKPRTTSNIFTHKADPLSSGTTTSNKGGSRNYLQRGAGQKNPSQRVSISQSKRHVPPISSPPSETSMWQQDGCLQNKNSNSNNKWKRVKGFLCEGDVDSAYREALCSGNEFLLIELLNTTGPVLESMSSKTISILLATLSSYLVEQRFINSVIPWLQQMVDLSSTHGADYVLVSAKAKQDLLCAVEENLNADNFHPGDRRFIMQLGVKMQQLWGE